MATKASEERPVYLSWLTTPGWLNGIASVGDLTGIVPYEGERFRREADYVMLHHDRLLLASDFKRAYEKALAEMRAQIAQAAGQEQLFDPDAD